MKIDGMNATQSRYKKKLEDELRSGISSEERFNMVKCNPKFQLSRICPLPFSPGKVAIFIDGKRYATFCDLKHALSARDLFVRFWSLAKKSRVEVSGADLQAMPVNMQLEPSTWEAWELLKPAIESLGYTIQVRSALRSCAEQKEQWDIGRLPGDMRQIVTDARGCMSWHVHGRALDLNLFREGKPAGEAGYAAAGKVAESQGWVWGGRFNDPGHFEYHSGLKIEKVCPDPGKCEDCKSCVKEPEASSSGPGWAIFLVTALGAGAVYLLHRISRKT